MRRRGVIVLVLLVAAFLAVRGVAAWRDTVDRVDDTPAAQSPTLRERTVEAGEVTVKVEPRRIDATGAEFAVSFDTHSVDLGFDVARNAHLTVGGAAWPAAAWSGSAAGGHHREGTLRFDAAGAPAGTATLHLTGLPQPATASWTLGG